MPAEKNPPAPQAADERLSRELLLRYMAAKAASTSLASLLARVSSDSPQPPAHFVRFPP